MSVVTSHVPSARWRVGDPRVGVDLGAALAGADGVGVGDAVRVEVYRHTWVTDLRQRADGTWDVITDRGEIHAEHIVNAGGLWAREVGRMIGLELPVLGMEHMYLVTEPMAEVADHNARHRPRDADGARLRRRDLHPPGAGRDAARHLRAGLRAVVAAARRRGASTWSCCRPTSTASPRRWRSPSSTTRRWRRPASSRIVNGPFTFAPDGNPLVGPIRGMRNCWVACAVMAGLSQGGGVGLALANWMTTGDPQLDIWGMDVARYGDWATLAYTNAKVRENYSRRFRITFPNEELPAGRPLHTTPDLRPAHRAQRGVGRRRSGSSTRCGSSARARSRSRTSRSAAPTPSRSWPRSAAAVRERVGLTECSNFAKYRVTGRRRGRAGCRGCSPTGCRRSAASR